ncbi:MAG: hypothetical protein V1856_03540, partial [Candidatus Liptonbacteria bacterium]
MGLPLPKRAPNQRQKDRIDQLLPKVLYERTCMCNLTSSEGQTAYANTAKHEHGNGPCKNKIQTPYPPDRPEIVYCEACYNNEIA